MSCTVIPARRWQHKINGRQVSPYGAQPWNNEADKINWDMVQVGWTVQNPDGTIGCGRPPSATREEAQALADRLNATGFKGMQQD